MKYVINIYTFNVRPFGVDADFLTDSTSFRVYLGQWDNEHVIVRYSCKGDSIIAYKIEDNGTTETMYFNSKKIKAGETPSSFNWN